uniref:Efflux ABC transporter, permease protein n=1 Tax=Parastrongyloides trichosuri TaxID=131310 RepID=A0A0N4ZZL5_PARTI
RGREARTGRGGGADGPALACGAGRGPVQLHHRRAGDDLGRLGAGVYGQGAGPDGGLPVGARAVRRADGRDRARGGARQPDGGDGLSGLPYGAGGRTARRAGAFHAGRVGSSRSLRKPDGQAGNRAATAGPVGAVARRSRGRRARGAASGVAAERRGAGARRLRRGAELPDRAQARRCGAGRHDGARGGTVGLRRRSGHRGRRRGRPEGGAGARSGDPLAVAALHVFQGVPGVAGLARGALAVDPGPRHPGVSLPEPDLGAVPTGHPPGGADRLGRLPGPRHGHRHRRDSADQ